MFKRVAIFFQALFCRREGLFLFIFFVMSCVYFTPHSRAQTIDSASTKEELRAQLKEVQAQIETLEIGVQEAKASQKTLAQEIILLQKEWEKQRLQLKEVDLSIRETQEELNEKKSEINGLENKLEEKKMLLHATLQKLNAYERMNWVGALFSGATLSDFFNHLRALHNLQSDVAEFIGSIDDTRKNLEDEQANLEDKKEEAARLKGLFSLKKQDLERKQKEKNSLIEKTKGQEKLYAAGIQKSKKDAVLIRQQLFTLESVGVSMSLGEAIERAKFTGEKTGVRPAFLLAIFQVESRLGTYVGGGSWRKDMKPKERPIFLQLMQKLGFDPDTMPVSKKPGYGWGGAMGPAQFIPSTWAAYENQIAGLTGNTPPSPWNIEDAFIASGLKLVGNGAGSRARTGEHTAAAKYLGGGNYKKRVSQMYANSVMDWADYYQEQIDALEGVSAKGAANSL